MPLTPMDMQVLMPRVQEINSAKQSFVNHSDNELAQAQQMTKDHEIIHQQSVNELEKKKDHKLDTRDKEERQKKKQQSKKRKKQKKEMSRLTGVGNKFDMKV